MGFRLSPDEKETQTASFTRFSTVFFFLFIEIACFATAFNRGTASEWSLKWNWCWWARGGGRSTGFFCCFYVHGNWKIFDSDTHQIAEAIATPAEAQHQQTGHDQLQNNRTDWMTIGFHSSGLPARCVLNRFGVEIFPFSEAKSSKRTTRVRF